MKKGDDAFEKRRRLLCPLVLFVFFVKSVVDKESETAVTWPTFASFNGPNCCRVAVEIDHIGGPFPRWSCGPQVQTDDMESDCNFGNSKLGGGFKYFLFSPLLG